MSGKLPSISTVISPRLSLFSLQLDLDPNKTLEELKLEANVNLPVAMRS